MVNMTVEADCGNAPKKLFLRDVNVAFAEGNVDFLQQSVTEDIVWHMVGDKKIEGKESFVEALNEMKNNKTSALTLTNIITHGKQAAVDGVITMQDGTDYAFCDVYEFRGAKGSQIKSIVSYVIVMNGTE